jgi:hypothetical protein
MSSSEVKGLRGRRLSVEAPFPPMMFVLLKLSILGNVTIFRKIIFVRKKLIFDKKFERDMNCSRKLALTIKTSTVVKNLGYFLDVRRGISVTIVPDSDPATAGSVINWFFRIGILAIYQRLKEISKKRLIFKFLILSSYETYILYYTY